MSARKFSMISPAIWRPGRFLSLGEAKWNGGWSNHIARWYRSLPDIGRQFFRPWRGTPAVKRLLAALQSLTLFCQFLKTCINFLNARHGHREPVIDRHDRQQP